MRRGRWTDRSVRLAVFLVTGLIYFHSPVRQYGDSFYSLLLSDALLSQGTFRLDAYFAEPLDPTRFPGLVGNSHQSLPYQVERQSGHVYYAFPPGSSLLSVPAVALGRLFGYTPVTADGGYDMEGEKELQRRLAALLCSLTVVVLYGAARRRLDRGRSLLIAGAVAFATPAWSTASRALWSHTWLLLLLALAVDELLRSASTATPVRAVWLGTLLGIGYWVRPTAAVPIVILLVWFAVCRRRQLLRLAGTIAVWCGALLAWSLLTFGTLLPSYFEPGRLHSRQFPEALLGNLISPGRGVLVYIPVVLYLAWLLARYRSRLSHRELAAAACAIAGIHWLVISRFPHWWGGHSYGPRLMTDVVPWLALVAILGVEARRRHVRTPPPAGSRWEAAVGACLLALSVGMHAAGGLSGATNRWNAEPINVDQAPQRLWDWRDPQFLAWR